MSFTKLNHHNHHHHHHPHQQQHVITPASLNNSPGAAVAKLMHFPNITSINSPANSTCSSSNETNSRLSSSSSSTTTSTTPSQQLNKNNDIINAAAVAAAAAAAYSRLQPQQLQEFQAASQHQNGYPPMPDPSLFAQFTVRT